MPYGGFLANELLIAQFSGVNGFLGTRGSLMLDTVFLAMLAVLPVMGISIWLVKYRRKFQLHKIIQLTLASALLLAVVAFEIEVRVTGWTDRALPSPYWQDGRWNDWIDASLAVHLCFAIPTPLLWMVVIVQALRRFPKPPRPNEYSRRHAIWAWLAAIAMSLTAITGWVFYWLAFAAE